MSVIKKYYNHLVVFLLRSRLRDSDPRPFPYHGNALPAELRRLKYYDCLTPLIINDFYSLGKSSSFPAV